MSATVGLLETLASSPRDDLAKLPEVYAERPRMRPGLRTEISFQQYAGTNIARWHYNLSGGAWHPYGSLFVIHAEDASAAKEKGHGND